MSTTPSEPAADVPVAVALEITGRVQGVGFRQAMQTKARELRLTGWVRNLRNGSVQAVVQGSSAQVASMLRWCRSGPPLARVVHVAQRAQPPEPGWQDFIWRDTADGG